MYKETFKQEKTRYEYSDILISNTGTEMDLTNINKELSIAWSKWKNHGMTRPQDKKQMKKDIIDLINTILD